MRVRVAAVLLVGFAVLAVPLSVAGSKSGSLTSQLNSVERKIRDTKHKIRVTEQEKNTVLGQLYSTERDLEDAQTSLSRNKLKLLDAHADLEETIKRLDRTRKQLARRRELLARRVVDIYEGEDLSYANVVLGATDMWTFLTRAYYLQRILDSDTQLISDIKADELAIEKDKARKAQRVQEIGSLQASLEAERNRIDSLAESKRSQLKQIESKKELYEKALDELLAKSQWIEDQIRRIQSTPTGQARLNREFKGGLAMPCSGRITSRFGYRVHPITGVYKLHTGVDIAAPTGTSIAAAGDGEVIMSGWMGPYGYAVVIDHGGGVSTLYGHCSKLLVKVGQQIKKGQSIGRVGSTGYSTGPHLHFEKRVNGTPVNPL